MNSLNELDALCLPELVRDNPVTFGFGGVDYEGTTGARDTMRMLTDGGQIRDHEFTILVAASQFSAVSVPDDGDKITVCVERNGIPCHTNDSTERVNARITQIGRAGAGLTITCRTESR